MTNETTNETTSETTEVDPRVQALAKYLDTSPEEIEEAYGDNSYSYGRQEYLVLTDAEADEACAERIRESLWAFNTNFIASHTSPRLNGKAREALSKMQEKLCEDANDLVEALISDMDTFIADAIGADGRGHFLAQYDGDENEEKVGDARFYLYRTN